jgi:Ser/Thr protein kinase RdoA (MazF antagonist)
VFGTVQRAVDAYLAGGAYRGARTDRAVSVDATNRLIDGCCYLFFGEDPHYPVLVAKGARTCSGKAVFESEYASLQTLESRGLNGVPAPLGLWRDGETLVTLQSALAGPLMKNVPGTQLFSPGAIDRTLEKVLDWWLAFQQAFDARPAKLTGDLYASTVLDPVERFRRRFLLDAGEVAFLARRYANDKALDGLELPFRPRHGDFCAANIVVQPERIGVFDWEFPLRPELPLFDLFYFIASLRFPYRGRAGESSHLESFAAVYWEDSYFATACRGLLARAAARLAVPREALADLFALSVIQVANMKYDGLLESHGMRGDPATEEEKRERWSVFDAPDTDEPMASIENGVCQNLRLVARRGLPSL